MGHPNKRYNFRGNTEDEHGGSYYVVDSETDERIAGPFASGPYATTVHERMNGQWHNPVGIEYDD